MENQGCRTKKNQDAHKNHANEHPHPTNSRKLPERQTNNCVRVPHLQNGKSFPPDGGKLVQRGIPRSPHILDGTWRCKKVILHLDLRNSILVANNVNNVTVEQALNTFLTGVTWGEEKDGQWVWASDHLSIKAPAPGKVTYYKFLERQLVRVPSDRKTLREATGDFTFTATGATFRPQFQTYLKSLKWPYGGEDGEHRDLTIPGNDGQLYHYILEGVYRLIHHFVDTGRDFALIVRTMGRDAPSAVRSLALGVKGYHPGFPRAVPVPVNRTTGNVWRPRHDLFVLEAYQPDSKTELLAKLTHERDIYRFLSSSQGICGYRDDFEFWLAHNYNHHAAKPLWVDPHDRNHHHIIFDDNFRAEDEDSIVDVRVFRQRGNTHACSLSRAQLSHLEDVFLVQADLTESIDDRDYFLRKVEQCEANYSRMLKLNAFPC